MAELGTNKNNNTELYVRTVTSALIVPKFALISWKLNIPVKVLYYYDYIYMCSLCCIFSEVTESGTQTREVETTDQGSQSIKRKNKQVCLYIYM